MRERISLQRGEHRWNVRLIARDLDLDHADADVFAAARRDSRVVVAPILTSQDGLRALLPATASDLVVVRLDAARDALDPVTWTVLEKIGSARPPPTER